MFARLIDMDKTSNIEVSFPSTSWRNLLKGQSPREEDLLFSARFRFRKQNTPSRPRWFYEVCASVLLR